MACGCEDELIGGKTDDAVVWFDGKYIALQSGTSLTLNADQWYDCRGWLDVYVLLEWQGANGGNLTVTLETAIAPSADAGAWQTVSSATATMSASAKVIKAPHTLTVPPMGVVRLVFAASGATATGVVRAQLVRKAAG